jgi:uncharacterized protein (DUF305 family)
VKIAPRVLVLSLLAAPATAIADPVDMDMPHVHMDMGAAGGQSAETSESSKAFEEASEKMHQNMMLSFSGDADVDFVQGMIPHHQGAIDMAQVEMKYGKDPEIRKLAEDIIRAQEAEISAMNAWLAKNKQK